MKKSRFLAAIVLSIALLILVIGPATAAFASNEGLTPGYWKQEHHYDDWIPTGYAPGDKVYDEFNAILSAWSYPTISSGYMYPDLTLIEALKLKGGGEKAFLRQAVAAMLNSAHPGIDHVTEQVLARQLNYAYNDPDYSFEDIKDHMEWWNTQADPW